MLILQTIIAIKKLFDIHTVQMYLMASIFCVLLFDMLGVLKRDWLIRGSNISIIVPFVDIFRMEEKNYNLNVLCHYYDDVTYKKKSRIINDTPFIYYKLKIFNFYQFRRLNIVSMTYLRPSACSFIYVIRYIDLRVNAYISLVIL